MLAFDPTMPAAVHTPPRRRPWTARLRPLLAVLLLGLALAGCASIPAQQMSDARQAFRAARAAGAERLAPKAFHEAQLLLEDADRFLGEGRYELAGKVAERAKYMALKARREALAAAAGEGTP